MTTVVEDRANHLVLYGISWETYTGMLNALGDRRLRHAYNEGTFEMMSPLTEHEWTKRLLARFIDAATLELGIPVKSVGSTTLRREQLRKGLEPDECYYIRHEPSVRGRDDYDPARDPPPDLAIEVKVTHSPVNRMEIYASLRIGEVWEVGRDGVSFYRLNRAGKYVKISRSRAIPLLTPAVIQEFLALRKTRDETALVRQFMGWVRSAQQKKSK